MIIDSILNFFRGATLPADRPGQIVPSAVIERFPLLQGLPRLIGLDLRQLTEEKVQPLAIDLAQQLDGTDFSGHVIIHNNFVVGAEKGEDVNGWPFWAVYIFMRNVNTTFMQDLCAKLYEVYGTPHLSHGAGKWTGHDHHEATSKKFVAHKCWQNLKLEGYELKRCELWLQTFEYGRIASLYYYVYQT